MALRGPYIYPTATERWLQDTGYLPPKGWDYKVKWQGNSSHTRRIRMGALKALQDEYPDLRINEVTTQHLVDHLVGGRTPDGKPWSTGTRRVKVVAITGLFDWAADEDIDLIPRNPAARLSAKLKKTATTGSGRVHNWLTGPEVRALLSSCDVSHPIGLRDRLVIELLVNTGLRVAEAAELNWDQVNLFAGQIQLVGKGSKAANLQLLPEAVEALRAWRAAYVEGLGGAEPLKLPVLVSCRSELTAGRYGPHHLRVVWGRRLGSHGIRKAVKRRGIMIDRPTLAPHDLRRTFAGLLELNEVPIHEISWRLRHSSVATTEIYLKDNPLRFRSTQARALY